MRSFIYLVAVAITITICLGMQNSAQLPVWMGGHYDPPRFVVIDTTSLFDRPLLLVVYHPKFDDSDVSIRNVQLISTMSVSDSVKIKPGDIVVRRLKIWGRTLLFPEDTVRYDLVDQVSKAWWIQKHREPNWPTLTEAVRQRFDSAAFTEIAAAIQDST